MLFRLLAAAASLALLLPAGGVAQPRQYSTEEIAADLAYGFCPLFLADSFPLTAPQLAERGFSPTVAKQNDPRFGEIRMVAAKRADGEVAFGGAAGKVCTVVVTGDRRGAALSRLRETMAWTGLDFKPAPHTGAAIPGVTVETFKAPVDGQMLYVQLIQAGGPTPSVMAQLFGMAK
ncbi:MAG TPA: hypothetical protein VD846_12060 [Allosphingosinicella sp.]|nr:hypothetical protein [Allosphingosinicella sp.]